MINIDECLWEATRTIRERDKFQANLETAYKMQISARNKGIGARINFASVAGKGSRIALWLPVRKGVKNSDETNAGR